MVAFHDDPLALALLEGILRGAGYRHVRTITDPARLLRAIDDTPDVVLVGLKAASVGGDVAAGLARLSATEGVPVLVITAEHSEDAMHRALALGAHDCLRDPLDASEILVRVRNSLRTRRLSLDVGRVRDEEHDVVTVVRDVLAGTGHHLTVEDPASGSVIFSTSRAPVALSALADAAPGGTGTPVTVDGVVEGPDGAEIPVELVVRSAEHRGRRLLVGVGRARQRVPEVSGDPIDADLLREAFVNAVSRELRTPLTVVVGVAQTLQRRGSELPDDVVSSLTDRLADNAERLLQLVSDLLDVTGSGGSGTSERRPVDLAEVVEAAVGSVAPRGRQVRTALAAVHVLVDRKQIERVASTLVDRAVRRSPIDGCVAIRLSSSPHGAHLVVEDSGRPVGDGPSTSGGPPAAASRAQDASSELGLVATFVRMNGGRFWIEDVTGGGSAVHVLMPSVDV